MNLLPAVQHNSNDDSSSSLRLEMGIRRIKTKLYDTIGTGLCRIFNSKYYYVILAGMAIIVINKLVTTSLIEQDNIRLASNEVSEYHREDFEDYGPRIDPPEYLLSELQSKENVVIDKAMQSSLSNIGSTKMLFAMIGTPLMEPPGFFPAAVTPQCLRTRTELNAHDDTFSMFDCPEGHQVLRTRKFDTGAKVIEQHRQENPQDECLIVTAIRDPKSWFQSYFLHSLDSQFSSCKLDKWATKEAFLMEFKAFVRNGNSALSLVIPGLLNEFSGGSLQAQVKIMNRNGNGQSTLLGPAPPESIVAGCNLLLMKMENIDLLSEFEHKEWPTKWKCPKLPEYVKMITDYELTAEEKISIYQRGDDFLRDWFDAYGYH